MNKPLFREMRLVVMYDLPTKSDKDKKNHQKFRQNLIKIGFVQAQESIYVKHCTNPDHVNRTILKIDKFAPEIGDIRLLSITEKQYLRIMQLRGEKSLDEQNLTNDSLVII